MHIVCPHCTTSYAIDLAALGTAGRNVRCSRCKETWLAYPEDVRATPMVAAAASEPAGDGDPESDGDWTAFAVDNAADGNGRGPGFLSRLRGRLPLPAPRLPRLAG